MGGGADSYEHDPYAMGDVPAHLLEPIRRMRRHTRGRLAWNIFFRSAIVAIGAWVLAQAFDRAVPTQAKVEITTPQVAPGSDLEMTVRPKRLKLCEGRVKFRAYDRVGNIINQSETSWSFPFGPLGEDKPFTRRIRISRDAVPSRRSDTGVCLADASMRIERDFFCNPVQKFLAWPIHESTADMMFCVVERRFRP